MLFVVNQWYMPYLIAIRDVRSDTYLDLADFTGTVPGVSL
ncbi:hypothetical protein DYBT9275_02191 [Dyadobacter sp. CECT 9275]|uniref:Uncharacterized protein n=1 Tax=Dyadobacter helix TaxID=2822344 RepID=A0A916N476_9BACT|nr:hypothetical protein DYBT9275_02191 [Dyadobacter sp. CECT 9275]